MTVVLTQEQASCGFEDMLVCMLWTSEEEGEDWSIDQLDPESVDKIWRIYKDFLSHDIVTEALSETPNTWKNVGHDFWLTSVGHGAGFWDGDWDTEHHDFGDKLTDLCRNSIDSCYKGDDDVIYITFSEASKGT